MWLCSKLRLYAGARNTSSTCCSAAALIHTHKHRFAVSLSIARQAFHGAGENNNGAPPPVTTTTNTMAMTTIFSAQSYAMCFMCIGWRQATNDDTLSGRQAGSRHWQASDDDDDDDDDCILLPRAAKFIVFIRLLWLLLFLSLSFTIAWVCVCCCCCWPPFRRNIPIERECREPAETATVASGDGRHFV